MLFKKRFSAFDILFLVIAIALIVLYLSNPDTEEFKLYFKEELLGEVYEESPLLGSLIDIFEKPAWQLLEKNLERKNYLFFSVYTLSFEGEELAYLGVLSGFRQLNKDN